MSLSQKTWSPTTSPRPKPLILEDQNIVRFELAPCKEQGYSAGEIVARSFFGNANTMYEFVRGAAPAGSRGA
jgi:hypothetical protein